MNDSCRILNTYSVITAVADDDDDNDSTGNSYVDIPAGNVVVDNDGYDDCVGYLKDDDDVDDDDSDDDDDDLIFAMFIVYVLLTSISKSVEPK